MIDPQRMHALDNLRAVMMWLGIVLHAAVNHLERYSPLPWRDRDTSLAADLAVSFIHAFRMPVFFILAGFLAALLASRRGYGGMLKHRLRRIGLPFIAFWPPIFIGMGLLAMLYVHLMVNGSYGIDPAIMPVDPVRPVINTMHLWFIYYLLWFCSMTALLGVVGQRIPASFKERVASLWLRLVSNRWGFMVLALPLAASGASYQFGVVSSSGSFIPRFDEVVYNGLFFVVGWHLYRYRLAMLERLAQHCWRYAAGGALFFILFLVLAERLNHDEAGIPSIRLGLGWLYGCASWLWSFALLGLFVRYLSKQNRFLRYVSDSSYWVYLVHMLGTVGFGVLLYDAPLHAVAKMFINILATTAACLVTYQLLVRYTIIGTLLNGHRRVIGEKQELGGRAPVA